MRAKGTQFSDPYGNIEQNQSMAGAAAQAQKSAQAPDTPTKETTPMQETPGGGYVDGNDYWPPLRTYDNMVDRGETTGPMSLG
jgi:hypothetical protein